MALKRLTTEDMAQLSGPWVTAGTDARKAILAVPEMAGVLPKVLLARASRLGELEDERAAIESAAAGPSDGARLVTARNQWIRAVNALVANADLAERDEAKSRLIFGSLRLAEKKADRRGKVPAAEAPEQQAAPEKAPA